MSVLWVSALLGIVAIALSGAILRTDRAYQFPFLASFLVVLFILPQLPGIFADPQVERSALSKTMFMTVLCLAAAIAGWSASRSSTAALQASFDEQRLSQIALVMALSGAFFYYRLSQLPGDTVIGVQMSGISVIYLFFGRLLTYGLLIACLLYARRPSWSMLLLIAFCLLFYVDRIVVTGKRAETMELFLIFVLAWWFHRRRKVSLTVLVAGAFAGIVIMTSMSAYREITRDSGVVLSEVKAIDAAGNLEELLRNGGEEMRNAIALIDATDREARFDFGAVHWNMVVSNYVPRQLFGSRVKSAMRLETPPWPRDFVPATGTTLTGMSDAFRSFWYVGALKFFLLGYVLRLFWNSAMEGQFLGQVLYCLSIVPGMHAFSHSTDWVVPVWIHLAIFLAPALVYARCRAGERSSLNPSASRTAGLGVSG